MNYLSECNTLQQFSEPNTFTEGNYIRIDLDPIKDDDGNEINPIFINTVPGSEKKLMITEIYRQSIFAREYGAGKTLHTFTLLPGEETEIYVTSKTEETLQTSSILDSYDAQSSLDYEEKVSAQETNRHTAEELQQISGAAKGRVSYGFDSAKGSTNFNYQMQASREAYGEKMTEALAQHATNQSAKRTIEVNTSSTESKAQNTVSVRRKIKNINNTRTLNFVFRQMNQYFVSIRHLVDIKIDIAEYTVDPIDNTKKILKSLTEYPLPNLKNLLNEHINERAHKQIESIILAQLEFFDYKDDKHVLYEPVPSEPDEKIEYYRFRRCYSRYDENDLVSCNSNKEVNLLGNCKEPIDVPGFILNVQTQVMKTNGIVVDAILGRNDAIQPHLIRMQDQEYLEKVIENRAIEIDEELKLYLLRLREEDHNEVKLENEEVKIFIDREKLAQEIVKNQDEDMAHQYKDVYCFECNCNSSLNHE
ncbi:hypothetical protein ACU3L3_14240 [Priestia endophytica]